MFNRMLIARVGLPKGVWEPLRKLNDVYGVDLHTLAESWCLSDREMLRVLYAARLAHLDRGEEVRWLEELGDGNANAVSSSR